MIRLAPLALLGLLAVPAQALDLTDMSEAERKAFREEVRTYLLENPEVIMEAVAVLQQREEQAQQQQRQQQAIDDIELVKDNAEALFNDGYSWVGGNPEGDITVVEFLDYRCSFCRKAFEEVNALIKNDGNIRFIVKELPILGQASTESSVFAVATKQVAGDEAYGLIHDALMEYRGPTGPADLARLAEGLGIDADPIVAHLNSPEVRAEIEKTHALADTLNIRGTPTFVFGGQMIRGYVELPVMEQIVADQRDG